MNERNRAAQATGSNDGQAADVIACDVSAIPADARAAHFALARTLLREAGAVREVANGLELQLTPDHLGRVATFLENERRCCSHLTFTLEVPPRGADLTLRVHGPGAREEMLALLA